MSDDADADDKAAKPKDMTEYVGRWVEAVEAARADEKAWRDEAQKAIDAFRGEKQSASRNFNLYHSNIEILAPAIFNSVPVPDVRRRFADEDLVGKYAADIIERSLSFSMDTYDFDQRVKLGVYDMAITGRGVLRVRYEPETGEDARLGVETVTYQQAPCEYVPWDRFIVGPAVTWDDVPWLCFEHFLSKDQVKVLAPKVYERVPYTHTAHGKDGEKKPTDAIPDAFKRAKIWEIWDKRTGKVTFICPEWKDEIVREEDDPLKLEHFFPVPRPMYAVAPVGKLAPVSPLSIYRDLLEELNEVTRRISRLVKQLRPRGWYIGTGLDMKAAAEADDGELTPLQGAEAMQLAQGPGGIAAAIGWFPLEPTVLALRELLAQRDAIKQTIYEVTGIADIMRGASEASETATAQKLKAQFGSVRVRAMQMEVARFVRDLLRIKAEIISRMFEPSVLMEMTNIKLLPQAQKQQLMQMAQANPEQAQQIAQQKPELAEMVQAPSQEEVFALLRSSKMRAYRIDIETDSTIRGDLMRNQEQMGMFLQGTAQFLSAIGPMVKEQAIPKDTAVELYAAFARQFQLGKSAEDALDKLAKSSQQAPPEDKGAAEAAKAKAEGETKLQIEQVKQQASQQTEAAKMQTQQQLEAVKLEAAQQQAMMKAQMDREKAQMAMQVEEMKAQLKIYELDQKDARERDANAMKIEAQGRKDALNAFTTMNKPQPSSRPKA